MATPKLPPNTVRRTLRKLGQDIREARKRRGLTMEIVAERAMTSRKSLQRVESGDHAVSIGIYASVLHALGLLEGLGDVANPSTDGQGLSLAAANLPERVRTSRK